MFFEGTQRNVDFLTKLQFASNSLECELKTQILYETYFVQLCKCTIFMIKFVFFLPVVFVRRIIETVFSQVTCLTEFARTCINFKKVVVVYDNDIDSSSDMTHFMIVSTTNIQRRFLKMCICEKKFQNKKPVTLRINLTILLKVQGGH